MESKNLTTKISELKQLYDTVLTKTDPRTRHLPLVWSDPTYVLLIVAAYYMFIKFGTAYMKNRPAFNIHPYILFTYNFSLVILSLYMFVELIFGLYQSKYTMLCDKLSYSTAPGPMRIAHVYWLYFFSKAIELMDTVWMILRKRFMQVTFLHCFHHSTMLLIWWVVVSYLASGQSYLGPLLNSLVHVVMYLYYALAALPTMKDKLWWKKYITTMQLTQFFIILSHISYGLYSGCDYPKWGSYLLTGYMLILITLFSNFFIKEYIEKSNERKRMKELKSKQGPTKKSVSKKSD